MYKAAQALRDMRPDLIVLEVDTTPTGVVVVLLPDATRNGVLPGYDEWLDVAVSPDPQPVPDEILTRSRALNPTDLLASKVWDEIVFLRQSRRREPVADRIRAALGSLVPATA